MEHLEDEVYIHPRKQALVHLVDESMKWMEFYYIVLLMGITGVLPVVKEPFNVIFVLLVTIL